MKYLKYTIIVICGIILGVTTLIASAQVRVITVSQGGTGVATLLGCLEGHGTDPVTGSGTPCGTGSGGGSSGGTWSTTTSSVPGRLINYSNNTTDIPCIGGTATTTCKFYFDPNTGRSWLINASTTLLTANTGYFGNVIATSTIAASSFASNVGISSTSPAFPLSIGTGAGSVAVNSLGQLSVETAGQFPNNNFFSAQFGNAIDIQGASSGFEIHDRNTASQLWQHYAQAGVFNIWNDTLGNLLSIKYSNGNVGISSSTPGTLFSVGTTNGINFTTATSSFSSTGGINLTSGCFAVGGVCLPPGGVTSIVAGTNVTISGATGAVTINATGGGGGASGTWASTTSSVSGRSINYSNATSPTTDIVAIGATATTTAKYWFDPNIPQTYLVGKVGISTTSPQTALEVDGDLTIQGTPGLTNANFITQSGDYAGKWAFTTQASDGKFTVYDYKNNRNIIYITPNSANNSLVITPSSVSSSVLFTDSTGIQGGYFQSTSAGANLYPAGAASTGITQTFYGGNGSAFVGNNFMLANGNFGLGNSNPLTKLNVQGEAVAQYFTATSTSASTFPYASTTALTVSGALYNTSLATPAGSFIAVDPNGKYIATTTPSGGSGSGTVNSGTIGQNAYYASSGTAVSGTSTIFIAPASIVGIGTITPADVNANSKLTVASIGSTDIIASTTDNTASSDAILQAYAPSSRIFMGAHGTNQATAIYGVTSGGWGEIAAINSTFGTSNGLMIGTRTTNTPIVFGTNSLERGRILGNGNWGIGTTSPYAILSVVGAGGIVADSYNATNTNATSTLSGGVIVGNQLNSDSQIQYGPDSFSWTAGYKSSDASFRISSSTAVGTNDVQILTKDGHMKISRGSRSAPSLSSCGTSPSISSDASDFSGTVTVGSVAATACTITFAIPFLSEPVCTVTNQNMSVVNAMTYTRSTTNLIVSQTGLTGDKLDYFCSGQ